MKKFIVAVEETVVQEFEITAESASEALALVQSGYKKGDIVLENAEVQHKQMAVMNDKEPSKWIAF